MKEQLLAAPVEQEAFEIEADEPAPLSIITPKGGLKFQKPNLVLPSSSTAAPLPPQNDLAQIASEIDALGQTQTFQRLAQVKAAKGRSDFELGGLLFRIREQGWAKGDFHKWAHDEIGKSRATVDALIMCYRKMLEIGITGAEADELDWTKFRAIAPILTKENFPEWRVKAKALSREKLDALVREAQQKPNEPNKAEALKVKLSPKPQYQDNAVSAARETLAKLPPKVLSTVLVSLIKDLEPQASESVLGGIWQNFGNT